MPSWSVPPGLMVPGPRQPDADDRPSERGARPSNRCPAFQPGPQPSPAESAADRSGSWPGVAPPAGWFLHSAQSLPADSGKPANDAPAEPELLAEPEFLAEPEPAAPASPWPNARAVPSPTREPDGSWSSPLTPKPSRRTLDPTQARYGRAGGPGFQPTRTDQPGSQGASTEGPGLSPWQRSHQVWTEAGIEWERRPAPQLPWRPTGSRSAAWPAAVRPGRTPVPLGAPVYSEPGVDEDQDPARDDHWGDDRWGDDRWDDDVPPIRQRPPGLMSPDEPDEMPDGDTLLFDHRPPGSRRAGSRRVSSGRPGSRRASPGRSSRRPMAIVVPVIVVVAVAALALALLTGHGLKFGPLTSDQNKTPKTNAPRLPLGTVAFDTYPGQQQRGVFQVINRIVAVGSTMVTTGSQSSDGVVRQQFLVSANAGASWHLAPVQAPGGGQAALGHPATLLAGGPGGWVAVGPQAIWTSPTGLTWTLAATHGITPEQPGDVVLGDQQDRHRLPGRRHGGRSRRRPAHRGDLDVAERPDLAASDRRAAGPGPARRDRAEHLVHHLAR